MHPAGDPGSRNGSGNGIDDPGPDTWILLPCRTLNGGMIALEILNIASERVLKLALLDTTAGSETMQRSRQRTEFLEDAERQGFEKTIEQRWINLMLTEEG